MSMQNERWNTAPYFLVPDIVQAAEWYRDKLGFSFEQYWENFTMVNRGNVTIMLSQVPLGSQYPEMINPNRKRDHHSWDAYIWIHNQDVDELYEEFAEREANIVQKPIDREDYGMREIEIMDPFGYVICFAQQIEEDKEEE